MKKQLAVVIIVAATLFSAQQASADCVEQAGPIWNNADAQTKCPATCTGRGYARWTGQWWTTVWGQMSVCQCQGLLRDVEAGPIWSNTDAQTKCPNTCFNANGYWTGQWWTTVWGQMSVCQCAVNACAG